ncbi:MAG TPA: 4a-hydroxytetrahydrobiopterin dehydratase [Candidatus Pacearchaeota archaeon]|nr:4a-hydroxytetrahydrobiopterin dehydratase [Candidatus Pacearchaeota archaeon]
MKWKIEKKLLTREFEFGSFIEAIEFVNKVSSLAENIDHHPDVLIHSENKVKIMLFTHSENKLTYKDYSLAEMIDNLFGE